MKEIKYLGITTDNLLWAKHVKDILAKPNRTMGLINRTLGYHALENIKCQMYLALVRSKLEYCTQVWDGGGGGGC